MWPLLIIPIPPLPSFKPKPLRPVRTEEQIQADLDARLAEIERQAENHRAQMRCKDCRWARGVYCVNPLVKGFKAPVAQFSTEADICGPEKALWQEKLPIIERFLAWLKP